MKGRVIIIVLLLTAALVGVYFYTRPSPTELAITGIVTTQDVIVGSQVQGRLAEVNVKEGDAVKKGELLATIQSGEWQADMSFYQQSQQQAAEQVAQAEANVRFQADQTAAQTAQAQASLASAEAQIKVAQADLENARLNFARQEDAKARGAVTAQDYDEARTAFDAQKARVDAAEKQRDSATAAVNVAKAGEQEVEARRATVEMNKSQLAAATAQTDKAKVQLGYTEIHAPIDAIVDTRVARQGEVVNAAGPIVTLINPDDLWVRADIEETYIDRIHLGDKFTVRLPSGATKDGVVFYRAVDGDYATQRDVSRTKRDIKTFEIRLRCDNTDRSLAVGMTATVLLNVGTPGSGGH